MQRGHLDDLLAFVAVARERSFTKAAAKLGVSQSALSHTIRELEARLGVRLLTRTTRSVSPTEAGERLLQHVGPRFEEIEAELAAVSELRDKPAGTIRITATEHAADTILCAEACAAPAAVPRHQGRDHHRLRPDRHRRRALRRRRAQRRAGGQGHDRGAHRAGHAHGGRRRAGLLPQAPGAEDAAGPDRPQLHQPAPADPWRAVCLGVREGRPRVERARRRPAHLQRHAPDAERRAGRLGPRLRAGGAWCSRHLAKGRLRRVLEDWCPPYSGYHLYYPSRRQSSAAFTLVVEALRDRR